MKVSSVSFGAMTETAGGPWTGCGGSAALGGKSYSECTTRQATARLTPELASRSPDTCYERGQGGGTLPAGRGDAAHNSWAPHPQ
eukprot:9428873-Pyramimonas_sp.AAC.1